MPVAIVVLVRWVKGFDKFCIKVKMCSISLGIGSEFQIFCQREILGYLLEETDTGCGLTWGMLGNMAVGEKELCVKNWNKKAPVTCLLIQYILRPDFIRIIRKLSNSTLHRQQIKENVYPASKQASSLEQVKKYNPRKGNSSPKKFQTCSLQRFGASKSQTNNTNTAAATETRATPGRREG